MNYSEARKKIQSGDLLFWKGTCFQSRIVRAFTGSTYSHVGVAWVVGGRVFVLEAVTSGVRIYPLSREIPFYWLPLRLLKWGDDAEEFALRHIGDEYSRLDAVKAFFRLPIKNSRWQCAEYAIEILRSMGYAVEIEATPEALAEWAHLMGAPITIVSGE